MQWNYVNCQSVGRFRDDLFIQECCVNEGVDRLIVSVVLFVLLVLLVL